MIKINGETINIALDKPISEILTDLGFNIKLIAVECNGEIIPRATYETAYFKDNDTIEVVRFVGGG